MEKCSHKHSGSGRSRNAVRKKGEEWGAAERDGKVREEEAE